MPSQQLLWPYFTPLYGGNSTDRMEIQILTFQTNRVSPFLRRKISFPFIQSIKNNRTKNTSIPFLKMPTYILSQSNQKHQ